MTARERDVDVLVVGAGQAGLGTAYWLRRLGVTDVLVVDAAPVGRAGSTAGTACSCSPRDGSAACPGCPRRFSGLPGLRFPAGSTRSPSRTEMAAYLHRYADHFDLPVRSRVTVQRLSGCSGDFTVETSAGTIAARQAWWPADPFGAPTSRRPLRD